MQVATESVSVCACVDGGRVRHDPMAIGILVNNTCTLTEQSGTR